MKLSQKQLKHFMSQLRDLKRECCANNIAPPKLKIDRETFRALDSAMAEYLDFGINTYFGIKPWRDLTFFRDPPMLLGFEIEIIEVCVQPRVEAEMVEY